MPRPKPNDTSDLLRGLRQRRRYTDLPIPDDILTDLLEVARWTGSSKNSQPWDFVVVRNRGDLETLSQSGDFAGFLAGVDTAIVLAMHPNHTPYDEGRVSERVMLLADTYGLGSGTGWFSAAGSKEVKRLLGIPDEMIVRSAIGLGFPDRSVPDRPPVNGGRRPFEEVVHYGRFGERAAERQG
ncbi:MAG TPA: nitroreductase family protein [Thermomicrobiales bacterium]|jgi:nitroreductase|nr:nitroreductase family protein [Thermomicrobiales bacterium]